LCRETIATADKSDLTRIARRKIATLIAPQEREAGIIMVDHRGRIGYAHNAETMEVAILDSRGAMRHEWTAPIAGLKASTARGK
jgi:isoaspartyl peptidase/L-asparaginase-like protein (Ntn-hydrolase superfamily)